jgi:hypothetical protein
MMEVAELATNVLMIPPMPLPKNLNPRAAGMMGTKNPVTARLVNVLSHVGTSARNLSTTARSSGYCDMTLG